VRRVSNRVELARSLWERLPRPAVLRALAALPCAVLVGVLLCLGPAPTQDGVRLWLDQGSAAAAEYGRFRARFPATELSVLRLGPSALRAGSAALTQWLVTTPGVLEVVSASELQPGWLDIPEHTLGYGCDSTGACYHIDDRRWAQARALHGPLSEQLGLLDLDAGAARVLVLARSQLEDSWGWDPPEPRGPTYRASRYRQRPAAALIGLVHDWVKEHLQLPAVLVAACLTAVLRRSWRLAFAAVAPAALAAAASEAVLLALEWPASIAEPCAELAVFLLVLAATLEVLGVERTRSWHCGEANPWRAPSLGAGRSALGLGALALASASLGLAGVPALRALGLQSAAGLLIGAALVSTLVPSLAALLPRQSAGKVPAAQAPQRRPGWQRLALLVAVAAVVASFVVTAGGFRTLGGELSWVGFLGYGALLFGFPLVWIAVRHGPAVLRRRFPLQRPAPPPPYVQRALDLYGASLAGLYTLALPLFLTAAPRSDERLEPEPLARRFGTASFGGRYAVQRLTRVELSLTTPETQLTPLGLARLAQLAQRLAREPASFAVIEPSLLLREAAYQLRRAPELPGPWLADAGVVGRLFGDYVADRGCTTRLSLLLEPPAELAPAAFAARLRLDAIAAQVRAELPDAELAITGPERLVAEAAFDPLRLPAFLILALVLASAFPRLIGADRARARGDEAAWLPWTQSTHSNGV